MPPGYGIGYGIGIASPVIIDLWILDTGFWNDEGEWQDDDFWKD